MSEHVTKIKPSLVNALVPIFIKDVIYSILITAIFFFTIHILKAVNVTKFSTSTKLNILIFVLVALVLTTSRIIILTSTTYYFYNDHIKSEFKFIAIKSFAAPYSSIVNISSSISLWDRLCNASDITLHTAEDNKDLVLRYITNPKKIEKIIYQMIKKSKSSKQ